MYLNPTIWGMIAGYRLKRCGLPIGLAVLSFFEEVGVIQFLWSK